VSGFWRAPDCTPSSVTSCLHLRQRRVQAAPLSLPPSFVASLPNSQPQLQRSKQHV
jgi:hypothetical protein